MSVKRQVKRLLVVTEPNGKNTVKSMGLIMRYIIVPTKNKFLVLKAFSAVAKRKVGTFGTEESAENFIKKCRQSNGG